MTFDWNEKQPIGSLDARFSVASGSKSVELLLFSIGTSRVFGLDVLKVSEFSRTPMIARTPNMPKGMKGLVSFHSKIFPVISLFSFLGGPGEASKNHERTLVIVEYLKRTLGFLVQDITEVARVEPENIRFFENILPSSGPDFILASAELENGTTVYLPDIEQILANVFSEAVIVNLPNMELGEGKSIFFVDDSIVARRKIVSALDKLGVNYKYANNGLQAWSRLQGMAVQAKQAGFRLHDILRCILVDAEMPEMDGYTLTKNIKADPRFAGIPVVMHSSLLSEADHVKGREVGVDGYISKFDSESLLNTLRPILGDRNAFGVMRNA
ncbi:MAG: chemotaxis protein [Candidatus Accumulibacter sp.]|jgi:two-component system chemotaxis response regulator CheV|nr:chemotaxis protein [Accumulibacter sp.]